MRHRTCIFRENMPSIPGDEWLYRGYSEQTESSIMYNEERRKLEAFRQETKAEAVVFCTRFQKVLRLELEYSKKNKFQREKLNVKIASTQNSEGKEIKNASWSEAEYFINTQLYAKNKTEGHEK